MRKKTQSEVEAVFVERGCQLLSQYVDAHAKLNAVCSQGHLFVTTWNSFSGPRRRGCAECAKEVRAAKRRTPFSVIQQAFADAGYQLLATEYKKNSIRMPCICPEGHEIKMDWASFKGGVRCGVCAPAKAGKNRKKGVAAKAKAAFEAEGYTLLDEYTNAHTPMRFICPQRHEHQISWTNFDTGYRCLYCSHNAPVEAGRVKESFESEGYTLLDEYTNKKRRLRFICPNNHKWSISWDNWNAGHRCAVCSGRVVTPKQVKDAFAAEGYQLLSKYRWNNTKKLNFICPERHEHQINWADWRSGCRCAKCNKPSVDPDVVEEFFLVLDYKPLARYTGSNIKIPYICPKDHQHSILWSSFRYGNRCPECAGKIIRHEDVEMAFASEGYELLDEYKNSHTHMRYACPEGHQHSIIWDAFKQGHRCPFCAGMHPTEEQREINAIKQRVAGLIYIHLKKQSATKPMRITKFAKQVAAEIREKLGVRPRADYHLDHIVPQTFFDFRYQHEIEACWHIDNLQWLPAFENVSKGHRLKFEDADLFSQNQLEILAIASRKPSKFNKYLAKRGVKVPVAETVSTQMELFSNLDKTI